MVLVIPLCACFEKVAAYPVICMQVEIRPYGHPNFAMEKPMHLNSIIKSLLAPFREQCLASRFGNKKY